MGCHANALARIDAQLSAATTDPTSSWAAHIDQLLEQRWAAVHLATEWDADRWGFDPSRWCEAERVELMRRAGEQMHPREPRMRAAP